LGFMMATLLLHGAGILTVRLLVLALTFFLGSSAYAQQAANTVPVKPKSPTRDNERLELSEIVVTQRADSQVGFADSASQGNVGQEQIN